MKGGYGQQPDGRKSPRCQYPSFYFFKFLIIKREVGKKLSITVTITLIILIKV